MKKGDWVRCPNNHLVGILEEIVLVSNPPLDRAGIRIRELTPLWRMKVVYQQPFSRPPDPKAEVYENHLVLTSMEEIIAMALENKL